VAGTDIAEAPGVSTRAIERAWVRARAYLFASLSTEGQVGGASRDFARPGGRSPA
jgi:hypothetical protein